MVHAMPFECGKYHMPLYMDIENLLDMNMFSFPCIREHIRNHSTALLLSLTSIYVCICTCRTSACTYMILVPNNSMDGALIMTVQDSDNGNTNAYTLYTY